MKPNPSKLIFIVDDDPDDQQFILDALLVNNNVFDHCFLNNAEDLLSSLQNADIKKPDLIVLDLNMPGMMGLQALKEIRSNAAYNPIPIVVLSTSTLEKDKTLSYDYGANCFLTKTHSYKKMIAIANSILVLWLT